jgi:hypothetical protein
MTADGLAGELPSRDASTEVDHILSVCDRRLGEVGRRAHLFTWLRAPEAGADEWLPVEAYYPRARLVVVYRERRRAHDHLYRELVPRHGLRLLELTPADLGLTPAGTERALARLIETLPSAPAEGQTKAPTSRRRASWSASVRRLAQTVARAPERPSSPAPSAVPPARTATAFERGSRFVNARRTERPPSRTESPTTGVVVALGLMLLLVVAVIYVASTLSG